MIIYNITTQVSWTIHDEWKEWILKDQIPGILSTGLISHFQLVRLLETDNEDGPTYAIQYYFENIARISTYREKHLSAFEQVEKNAWGDNIYSFSSLMEVIN